MAKIKPMGRITETWDRRSAASTPDYEAGVRDPAKDWAEEASGAEDNYNAGVQAAIARGAFGKGVTNAGTAKWQKNAIEKGTQRWAAGIRLAKDAYVRGFSPFHAVIQNTTLPPRGPKGDPKNIRRVEVMAAALHEEKLRQQGA